MAIGTKSKTTNINSFTIDGKEIRDPKEIVDKLNQYFCNTTKRVQEEAFTGNTETTNVDFQSYLTKSPKTARTFRVKQITPNDIVQSIAKLKNSRSIIFQQDSSNQSSDILQHSRNRPTGDRWLKF